MDLGLGAYADNILALAVLGGIVLLVVILGIYMWKILPLKIEKMWTGNTSGEQGSAAGEKKEAVKKEGFIPHLDKTLERIERKIEDIEKRLNHVDKSALKNLIYNQDIHILDRLHAFDSYLRLEGNGSVTEYAVKTLIISNRDDWLWVIQRNTMKIYREEIYREQVAEISKQISQS